MLEGAMDIIENTPFLVKGFLLTISMALGVMGISLITGLLIAIARCFQIPLLSQLCQGYVYLLRSMPLVMIIAGVHFAFLPALGIESSVIMSAVVAFVLSNTAYIAEIFRGGFLSLSKEELDAAQALGLNKFQRLQKVYIPLMTVRMMPSLINQFVTLIKDTSLASIIGVMELTRTAEIVYERTLHEATMLTFLALIYFVLCYTLSQWGRRYAQRYNLVAPAVA